MNEIINAADALDLSMLKNADKDIYASYTLGSHCLKQNLKTDIDYISQINKSFFHHYESLIAALPEQDQPIERIKLKLALDQIESAFKILTYNKNILDKNRFMFYNIAYVSDILRRNCSNNNQG